MADDPVIHQTVTDPSILPATVASGTAVGDPSDQSFLRRARRVGADKAQAMRVMAQGLPASTVAAVGERIDRLVARVVEHPSGVSTTDELAASLTRLRTGEKNTATSAATLLASTALAKRSLQFGSRKVPVLAAATGAAAALSIFAQGFRELRLIASHLVHRARTAGVDVDPGALRSVALQIYLRPDEAPTLESAPSLLTARVATRWARTAAASVLPLVSDSWGVPKVDTWVAAAQRVDLRLLTGR